MTAWVALLVAAGAGLGAGLRFVAALHLDRSWPHGTLMVNVVGSGVAGAAVALLDDPGGADRAAAFLVVGLAGGLTTLSGLAGQVHDLGWRRGTAYGATTLALATATCAAAYLLLG
ncbi:FluC/FEX family fluoride channel [Nocardioides solisilvae]|uniref:FluC/FEX family fluoride channel n=1 Tax=Nocardioides solisilvae TaxID=1542435 RepID=UPI000D7447E7|nr:CrcB family protein [Nocardioides solisilvae]